MTNGFLVSVPHEGLHGAISILEQRPELPTNMVCCTPDECQPCDKLLVTHPNP